MSVNRYLFCSVFNLKLSCSPQNVGLISVVRCFLILPPGTEFEGTGFAQKICGVSIVRAGGLGVLCMRFGGRLMQKQRVVPLDAESHTPPNTWTLQPQRTVPETSFFKQRSHLPLGGLLWAGTGVPHTYRTAGTGVSHTYRRRKFWKAVFKGNCLGWI